jgi:transcriptional regulator with XRE-family HTH domain
LRNHSSVREIDKLENGHTVPSIETLEKLAQALGTPIYAILYQGEEPPRIEKTERRINDWASDLRGKRLFNKLRRALAQMESANRVLLFQVAQKIVSGKRGKKS